jgi:voltage-dependent potassium channel beta subunit
MKYNRLGDTGLLVSQLSLGSWVTFDISGDAGTIGKSENGTSRATAADAAYAIMKRAYDGGINFFDNAEGYANGDSERIMGDAVRLGVERGAWSREDLVLTTKIFFGADTRKGSITVNRFGLSRKHIIEGLRASLERMSLDHVDVAFCHRCDPVTPMEEVVRGFNAAIDLGLCFYWATSEWSAAELLLAKEIADRLHLVPPCADQSQYSLLTRGRVEVEYAPLYPKAAQGGMGLGLTIWSPLASGILTGKYGQGIPEGSRLSKESFKSRADYKVFMKKAVQAERLRPIAQQLDCTMGQLALAWCMANPNVSTTITGATHVAQVDEQLGALPVIERLTPELMSAIDDALGPDVCERAKEPMPDAASMRPLRTKKLSSGALSKL